MKKFFNYIKNTLSHKISFWKLKNLKSKLIEYGPTFLIILIIVELVEHIGLPILFGWLGLNVHEVFLVAVPAPLFVCLHFITAPLVFFIYISITKKNKESKYSSGLSEFTKNVVKLLTTISIAQLIPFIITPILTQYFSAEEFGLTIPYLGELSASQFMGVNPLYIILLVPVFNFAWKYLKQKKREPSAPMKFAIGTILLGLGFLAFPLGGLFSEAGMVPMVFLLLAYLLHTLGELCLSPVGLSLVTKLAPKQIVGFVMGFWFLSSSLAHLLGKFIAQETDAGDLSPVEALDTFNGVFTMVGFFAIGAGVILVFISPRIKKWMHNVE